MKNIIMVFFIGIVAECVCSTGEARAQNYDRCLLKGERKHIEYQIQDEIERVVYSAPTGKAKASYILRNDLPPVGSSTGIFLNLQSCYLLTTYDSYASAARECAGSVSALRSVLQDRQDNIMQALDVQEALAWPQSRAPLHILDQWLVAADCYWYPRQKSGEITQPQAEACWQNRHDVALARICSRLDDARERLSSIKQVTAQCFRYLNQIESRAGTEQTSPPVIAESEQLEKRDKRCL